MTCSLSCAESTTRPPSLPSIVYIWLGKKKKKKRRKKTKAVPTSKRGHFFHPITFPRGNGGRERSFQRRKTHLEYGIGVWKDQNLSDCSTGVELLEMEARRNIGRADHRKIDRCVSMKERCTARTVAEKPVLRRTRKPINMHN